MTSAHVRPITPGNDAGGKIANENQRILDLISCPCAHDSKCTSSWDVDEIPIDKYLGKLAPLPHGTRALLSTAWYKLHNMEVEHQI